MMITTVYIVSYYQLKDDAWRTDSRVIEDVNELAEFIVMLETNHDEYRLATVNANLIEPSIPMDPGEAGLACAQGARIQSSGCPGSMSREPCSVCPRMVRPQNRGVGIPGW